VGPALPTKRRASYGPVLDLIFLDDGAEDVTQRDVHRTVPNPGHTHAVTLAPTPGPDDGETLQQVVKVLIAALGGGLGFMVGGPVGAAAVAGATESAGVVLDVLAHRMRQRSTSNAGRAIDVAIHASCLSAAQLIDALTRDPSTCLLATTALSAAADTALQEKIRLMGHVLANAATDVAVVERLLRVLRPEEVVRPWITNSQHRPVATLRYWRHLRTGPRSFRLGRRVLYRRDDLTAWIDDQHRRSHCDGS
jgi:hypothetical protein